MRRLLNVLVLVAVQLAVWGGWMAPAMAFTQEQMLFNEAWRIVNQSYVDASFNHQNWYRLREQRLKQPLPDRETTYQAIEQILGQLGDPFTRLLRPEQYRSLKVSTAGELSGVGLQIGFDAQSETIVVIAPLEGSPAAKAGILAGEQILAIDQERTQGMSLDDAAARMRGAAGTTVQLTLQREAGEPRTLALVRDRIALNPVVSLLDRDSADRPIGYVRLNQFNANAPMEMAHALVRLEHQGAQAYILDLRNNPGGLLQSGIEIARDFIAEGPIVFTVNRQGLLDSFEATDRALTDKPLIVLVNRGTASASEILAGALQDSGRAKLVGDRTFGKGLIQSLFELSDGSGMAVTVAKYETPAHHDINQQGIQPDQVVELQEPLLPGQIGTAEDSQYQAAIALLKRQTLQARAA
jgi:carboxyl-terminal processing protease